MATVTIEVPEELLGDLYIAVGRVLRNAENEAAEERRQAASGSQQSQDDGGAGA